MFTEKCAFSFSSKPTKLILLGVSHWVVTRMYQQKEALCMFSGEVTWPLCTEDKRIGWSDIVSNQPPVSVG